MGVRRVLLQSGRYWGLTALMPNTMKQKKLGQTGIMTWMILRSSLLSQTLIIQVGEKIDGVR